MHLRPSENKHLLEMNSFFNEIINLNNQKKMPNKILLSGKKGLGKSTLAYHVINYILSENEDYKYDIKEFKIHNENKSYKFNKTQHCSHNENINFH